MSTSCHKLDDDSQVLFELPSRLGYLARRELNTLRIDFALRTRAKAMYSIRDSVY